MFDTINGIPVHPLVVHAIVVLLPLTIVGTVLIVIRPRWRVTYGPLVVVSALMSTVLLPVATESGEALEEHVGEPGDHAELGESLIWFAIPLLVLVAVLVVQAFRAAKASSGVAPSAEGLSVKVVAVLALVAAVAAGVQVYRVGDSGARAVWEDEVSSSQHVLP